MVIFHNFSVGVAQKKDEFLCNIANSTLSQLYIIVPEQFHFETEKRMYRLLGAKDFSKVNVTSFTKIAAEILTKYCPRKTYADDVIKGCVMHRVTNTIKHMFKYYTTGADEAIDIIAELKHAGVKFSDLLPFEQPETDSDFSDKMYDLSQIYKAYNSELQMYWNDQLDDIIKATEYVSQYFRNAVIVIDEFDRLSGAQMNFVTAAASACDDMYICLYKTEYRNNSFAKLSDNPPRDDYCVEKPHNKAEYYIFPDVYEEVKFAAAKTFELDCYDNTAIISREKLLLPRIESAFQLYDMPLFADIAEPIAKKPLIGFILTVLDALDFTKPNIIKYIKSGFVRVPQSLEQRVTGKMTLKKLKHPQKQPYTKTGNVISKRLSIRVQDALCYEIEISKKKISPVLKFGTDELNNIWHDIYSKLQLLAKNTRSATGDIITEQLCDFLINTLELQRTVFALCNKRTDGFAKGFTIDKYLNDEYRMLWDAIIDIFESMHAGLKGYAVTVADYRTLLYKFCNTATIAKPPQYFNTVVYGDPDRMRLTSAKYVFLLETQAGIFPKSGRKCAFTASETAKLRDRGIAVDGDRVSEYEFERYLVSKTLALAECKTFICSSVRSLSGNEQNVSPLYTNALLSPLPSQYYYIKTLAAAKDYYAKNHTDTAVRAVLCRHGTADFVRKIEKDVSKNYNFDYEITANSAVKLFSEQIYSPTQIEAMAECRFKYFLKYGLGFRKRDTAFVSKGNIIHSCLDYVIRKFINDFDSFIAIDDFAPVAAEALTAATQNIEVPNENLHIQTELKRGTIRLFEHIKQEFSHSNFRPTDVETDLTFPFAGVIIKGKTDRIDIIETSTAPDKFPDQSVRIIDYKTGEKTFSQSAIKYGLNLQALLYLFGVCGDGKSEKHPSGAYYFRSKADTFTEEDYSPENGFAADIPDSKYYKTLFSEHKKRGITFGGTGATDTENTEKSLRNISHSSTVSKFTHHDIFPAEEYTAIHSDAAQAVALNLSKIQQGDIKAVPVGVKDIRCDSCEFRAICANRGKFPIIIDNS